VAYSKSKLRKQHQRGGKACNDYQRSHHMIFGKMQNQVVNVVVVWPKRAFFMPSTTKKHTARIEYGNNKNAKSSQSHQGLMGNKNRQYNRLICHKIHGKEVKKKPQEQRASVSHKHLVFVREIEA
jgi:hypothetical protein